MKLSHKECIKGSIKLRLALTLLLSLQWLLHRQQSQHVNGLLSTLVGKVSLLPCCWICTKSDLSGCKVGLLLPCSCMQFFKLDIFGIYLIQPHLTKNWGDYIVFVWAKIHLGIYIFYKNTDLINMCANIIWYTKLQLLLFYSRVNAS